MQTLLDVIQQNKNKPADPNTNPLGTGSLIQSTLNAKTGKAGQDAGVPVGSLGGQVAQEQNNLGLATLNQTAKSQDMGAMIAAQGDEQKFQDNNADLLHNRAVQLANYSQQSNQLLHQLQSSKDELSVKQQVAGLEQAGFLLAQQDKDYMDKLNYEGKRRRLDDDATFKTELQKSALGDMYNLFQDDLAFKSVFNSNQRDFSRQMASINVDQAMQIAKAQTQAANTQAIFTGVGGLASAGAQAYAKSPSSSSSSGNTNGYGSGGPSSLSYADTHTNGGYGGGGPR